MAQEVTNICPIITDNVRDDLSVIADCQWWVATWVHLGSLGFTWVHLGSLKSTFLVGFRFHRTEVLGGAWVRSHMTWVHSSLLGRSDRVFFSLLTNKKSTWLYLDTFLPKRGLLFVRVRIKHGGVINIGDRLSVGFKIGSGRQCHLDYSL